MENYEKTGRGKDSWKQKRRNLKSKSDGGCGERDRHSSLRVWPAAAAHAPAEDRTSICKRAALTGQRGGTEQELARGVLEGELEAEVGRGYDLAMCTIHQ